MKILLHTMLLLLALPALATSQEINQKSADGLKIGHWREEQNAGKVMEGDYENGKRTGVWTTTKASGTVVSKITYENGVAKGEATFYYDNGVVQEHGMWNVDHWEGDYENGKPYCKFNYNELGKREGNQVYYHENGKRMYEGTWKGGKINGTLAIYNENGIKTAERTYDNGGKFTGRRDIDAPTAPVESNASFTGTGKFTLYHMDGRIDQKGDFVEGKLVNGEKYIYNQRNKVDYIEIYKNGKVTGTK